MKTLLILLSSLLLFSMVFISCSKDMDIVGVDYYDIPSDITSYINPSHPKADVYQALLNKLVRNGAPGALMLIKTPDDGVWAGASGLADIYSSVPMKINFISRIGSITKTFVAVTILKLYEEGKLQLDDKANFYIDSGICDRIENCNSVTIRQLLNHTSGIYNYDDSIDCRLEFFNDPDKEWTWQETLEYVYGKPAKFRPGEGMSYSNTNYILLSLVIDRIEGRNHSVVIKEKVLTPLGLNSTFYNPDIPVPKGTVRGYWDMHNDGIVTDATEIHYSHRLAEGGMVSSLLDMMIFAEALYNGDLLEDSSLAEMTDWKAWPGDEFYSYGLGLQKWDSAYGECWGHSGSVIGYKARMFIFLDSDTIFILMTNGTEGKPEKAISDFIPYNDNRGEIFDAVFGN